jgi:hypothetical protein
MSCHDLKTWPEFFEAVWDGRKTAELRRNDRGFAVGDAVLLQEYDPTSGTYSGREIPARITHIAGDTRFGLQEGYIMFSFAVLDHVYASPEDLAAS